MSNEYYSSSGAPVTNSFAASAPIRNQYNLVEAGFDKLPALTGNASKAVVINSSGTGITVTVGTLALAGNLITTGAFNTTFVQVASVSITLPAVSGLTLATLTGTETLTNKTLTSPTMTAPVLGVIASGDLSAGTGNATGLTVGNVSGIVAGANGGTGVANTGMTITLAGNLITTGAFNTTFAQTASVTHTLPSGAGTLLSTAAAVTVAQGGTGVASLTAYAVICGGTTGTGAVQSIAGVGTSGQVLTSNGAAALPTFQTVTASALTLITTLTASTSASLIDTTSITSAYDCYMIEFENLTSASGAAFRMEASVDGGSSYLGGVYDNQTLLASDATVTGDRNANASNIELSALTAVSSSSGEGFSGTLWLGGPNLGVAKSCWWQGGIGGNGVFSVTGICSIGTASAINALKWTCQSGNIGVGKIRIYGVKTS